MPGKQKHESPEGLLERFKRAVQDLSDAGELNLTKADARSDEAMRRLASNGSKLPDHQTCPPDGPKTSRPGTFGGKVREAGEKRSPIPDAPHSFGLEIMHEVSARPYERV